MMGNEGESYLKDAENIKAVLYKSMYKNFFLH